MTEEVEKATSTNASKQELEGASEYLGKHNFKTLVEWMTAEVILNRPKDPLAFLRDVICEKIEGRQGKAYNPADCLVYAKECYQEAAETADDDGQIHPRKIPRKPSSLADTTEMRKRLETLEQAIKSSRSIASQLDPYDATGVIIKETCQLLNCDRATLFTVDNNTNELKLMVAKGAEEIRLPIGQGIAGSVAAGGKLTNIPDAYQDGRFDSAHDENTGYKTKSILAAPVIDASGDIVGVIQAINRFSESSRAYLSGMDNYSTNEEESKEEQEGKLDTFTPMDEEMISILAAQAGIALNNANLYQSIASSQEKIQSLLDIIRAMHSNLGVNSLLFTITQRAHELVEADRCTMFLLDKAAKELMSLQGEVNLRIPMDKGIAGECCVKNDIINIPDAYADPRFNKDVDKKSGYRTRTILCMPCRDSDGSVVGVIQLINKRKGVFDENDISIMDSFLVIAGPVLAQSQLFQQRTNHAKSDEVNEFVGNAPAHLSSKDIQHEQAIAEGEEEEYEDE